MTAIPADVNPQLLIWAREQSGHDADRIAKRLQVKAARVLAWEAGEQKPTFRQVEKLAQFLHRPFSVFFLPAPPQLSPLAAEYRRLAGVEPGHESPELRLALRAMLIRRENALNLMGELGEQVPAFRISAHLDETAQEVGRRLREASAISVAIQLSWPDEWRAWNAWRSSAEQMGVLVFQFSKVRLDEVRGLALPRAPLPVVAINGKEQPAAKIYTLFHEMVHLMLSAAKEETVALDERRSASAWAKVERFAEVAASHALVPDDALRTVIRDLGLPTGVWDIPGVRRLSKKFHVTPLATATRLREAGFMTRDHYRHWRTEWDAYVAALPPRRGGFATPAEKALSRAGRPFAQLVLEALSANRITSVDAAHYLDLRFGHFDDLRAHLTRGSGGASLDE